MSTNKLEKAIHTSIISDNNELDEENYLNLISESEHVLTGNTEDYISIYFYILNLSYYLIIFQGIFLE